MWCRRAAAQEASCWRTLALGILDGTLRADALDALATKRDNVEGASLFSLLPANRSRQLVRLLVAYQTMWDFLDTISERESEHGQANGSQLHKALVEALDIDAPISDYYRYHPCKDDDGYLARLVVTCRQMCSEMPCYPQVRTLMLEAVKRCAIQTLNHEPDARRRDTALRQWAEREFPDEHELAWFEIAAAASAFTPHILLALAAESTCDQAGVNAVYALYFPWVSLSIAMLDSYIDRLEDVTAGNHSYISHYPNEQVALERLSEIIRQIADSASRVPNGPRHGVLAEGIVAWHLAIAVTGTPADHAQQARMLVRAGGPLTRVLFMLASPWRAARSSYCDSKPAGGRRSEGLPLPAAFLTYMYWRWPFGYMQRCQARYGMRFTHRMTGFPRMVFVSDRHDVKTMLAARPDMLLPGEGGAKIMPIVGDQSFMLRDGDEHMCVRKAILHVFRNEVLELECEWVQERVRTAVATWPRGVPAQLHSRLRILALEVILRRIFGGRVQAERLALLRDRVLDTLAVTGTVVFPLPALRHGPGRHVWERFLNNRAATDEAIHELIDARLEEGGSLPEQDALAALLAARNPDGTPMSRLQLRDNVMSLILAGHETTASQLSWAFQLLAHNPRVQRRLIEEIDDPEAGEEYLSATIQEVLRHRPVFLFAIPRAVKRPIEIGERLYEPSVHLLACIYLLHHDPAVYEDPDRFRPERFIEAQPGPYEWMPWGGGRKRCPGARLATLEMKMVLRTALESVTIRPASGRIERPRWRSVIVTPHRGSRVVLCPRERARGRPRRLIGVSEEGCPMPNAPPSG